MHFEILNRFTGAVQFSCELDCPADDLPSVKLGLAVKIAIKEKADLSRANLNGAYLSRAYLNGADLSRANLNGANLNGANLSRADLSGAYLRRAYLKDATGAELAIAQTRILPEGDLIGWKKCRDGVIVKLRIPGEAKRSHAFGRKCRAEYADVIEVIGAEFGLSLHDGETKYVAGERVTPDEFDENWQDECSHGVHFFISRIEAESYSY